MVYSLTTKDNPEIPENVVIFFNHDKTMNLLGYVAVVDRLIYSNQLVITEEVSGIKDKVVEETIGLLIRNAKNTLFEVANKKGKILSN